MGSQLTDYTEYMGALACECGLNPDDLRTCAYYFSHPLSPAIDAKANYPAEMALCFESSGYIFKPQRFEEHNIL